MAGRLDGETGVTADGSAERDEQMREDRDGVGLGVWGGRSDDLAGGAGEGGGLGWWREPVGHRQQHALLVVVVRPVEEGEGHSSATSATAARAAPSSTSPLPAANAAMSDWTASLLISLGS